MDIMTQAKFHFNRLMLTLIFGIRASGAPLPRAWRTTEKAGPDRVNMKCVMVRFPTHVTASSLSEIVYKD